MNIGERNQIQGSSTRFQGKQEYEQLENLIEDKSGVQCTVIVKPSCILLRTKDYADYVLARKEIRGRTSKNIQRDLGEP